jgi:hypothetical protein
MISLGFPRRSKWWIVASLAVRFGLPAIIAVTWFERGLRPRQKYDSVGIRLTPLRHSQGLVSPRISSKSGRRISTASGVTWTRKKAFT